MINQFLQDRFDEMKEEIDVFADLGGLAVQRLQGALNVIKVALESVRKYVTERSFESDQQEIAFFKYDKPRFYAEQIFILEQYTVDHGAPSGRDDLRQQYYLKEISFIDRFFYQYRFLYQYYQINATELDHLYFLRSGRPQNPMLSEPHDPDSSFSTAGDLLFAKFMAFERLKDYLQERLHTPGSAPASVTLSKKGREIKWTGDKSNLIELAYAIYDTMQINDGNVDISDIVDWFEQSLQVNLSRYYRRFSEIKARKSISKTKYLDEMRQALLRRIDESDAYKPNGR